MLLERLESAEHIKLETSASSSGTCGELVQGQFSDGRDFLVTLPVALWTEVHLKLTPTSSTIQSNTIGKGKTQQAIKKTLGYLGYPSFGARFNVRSEIPEGKGMASSTADIVAACRATAEALGQSLSAEEISRIAISIEPSDGIMYPGVVTYNHRRGELIETLGELPPMSLLALDLGGHVDTLQFNKKEKNYSAKELAKIERAYELIKAGLREGSLEKIGRAATMSAKINQRLLPKPHLDRLIEIAEVYKAYGICIAHSGTIAALIFDRDATQALEKTKEVIWQEIGSNLFEIVPLAGFTRE